MQSASAEELVGSSNPNPVPRAQTGTHRFMLTLCALQAPVSIQPPRSPQLEPFRFFMSRVRQADGAERLYLHMGFFETLAEAERWAESVRRHYPTAFATIAPLALSRTATPEAPAPSLSAPPVPQSSHPAQLRDPVLTDTQVLEILKTRGAATVPGEPDERTCDQIALLRPEDTATRKALKEAVVQGAQVSFAVQLHWSAQPIDLSRVRSLDAFKGHTLYATESHRNGRSSYFLRLGFFSDPGSAKRVAVQVRSSFASAAVIPVVEPEITRSREAAVSSSAIPSLVEQRLDQEKDFDSHDTQAPSERSRPLNRVHGHAKRVDRARDPRDGSATWTESDPLSESAVRHLKVEVQEQLSGRWRVVKLREAASGDLHVAS